MDDTTLADHLVEIRAMLLTVTKFVLADIASKENVPTKEIAARYKQRLERERNRLRHNHNSLDWPDDLE